MTKVAIVYVNDTKHVVACATAVGDLTLGAAADLVGDGVFLRNSAGRGATVFLPAEQVLGFANADVSGNALAQLLTNPNTSSLPDDHTPVVAAASFGSTTNPPASSFQFTFAAPGKVLKVVLAHQSGAPGSDNPAVVITDTINATDTSKTINVDYRTGDALALFVEGFLPLVV